jgi:hypothetical protein
VDAPGLMLPEMNVLRGDLLRDTGSTDAAVDAWTHAAGHVAPDRGTAARAACADAAGRRGGWSRARRIGRRAARCLRGASPRASTTADLREANALLVPWTRVRLRSVACPRGPAQVEPRSEQPAPADARGRDAPLTTSPLRCSG